MSFLQPWLLVGLPLVSLPIIIHLINQRRFQTIRWAAMMFLLAANRMSRGYSRLRQWLIMLFRMLVIAGLIFAVARPLASGWLGLAAGGRADTTIILLDRSPSMQQKGQGTGASKLETGCRQLVQTLSTLGSSRWVLIESTSNKPLDLESPDALLKLPERRTGKLSGRPPRLAASRLRLCKVEPGRPDRDLDLLRYPRQRLERRERSLANPAGRISGARSRNSLPLARLSADFVGKCRGPGDGRPPPDNQRRRANYWSRCSSLATAMPTPRRRSRWNSTSKGRVPPLTSK